MKTNNKWIHAGIALTSDVKSKVICPECEKVNLEFIDCENPQNLNEIERLIYCSNCGAKNYIRLKKKVQNEF